MKEVTRSPEKRSAWGLFSDLDDVFDDFWRPIRATTAVLSRPPWT
jgi:hypothetical protein